MLIAESEFCKHVVAGAWRGTRGPCWLCPSDPLRSLHRPPFSSPEAKSPQKGLEWPLPTWAHPALLLSGDIEACVYCPTGVDEDLGEGNRQPFCLKRHIQH